MLSLGLNGDNTQRKRKLSAAKPSQVSPPKSSMELICEGEPVVSNQKRVSGEDAVLQRRL